MRLRFFIVSGVVGACLFHGALYQGLASWLRMEGEGVHRCEKRLKMISSLRQDRPELDNPEPEPELARPAPALPVPIPDPSPIIPPPARDEWLCRPLPDTGLLAQLRKAEVPEVVPIDLPIVDVVLPQQPERETPSMPAKPPSHESTVQAGERLDYRTLVKMMLAQAKIYPYRARRLHLEGSVGVSFSIGANGTIGTVCVERSSGVRVLDRAAVELLHRVKRLPPPPTVPFKMRVTFRYHLLEETR